MSFDSVLSNIADTAESVSIPLEQGYVFRPDWHDNTLSEQIVSIPLEQGNVFRLCKCVTVQSGWSLNPFGTGQCLSTNRRASCSGLSRLNPFGTGQCLSTVLTKGTDVNATLSQSLWNRAMSFDLRRAYENEFFRSQSLWNRAMSFDFSHQSIR